MTDEWSLYATHWNISIFFFIHLEFSIWCSFFFSIKKILFFNFIFDSWLTRISFKHKVSPTINAKVHMHAHSHKQIDTFGIWCMEFHKIEPKNNYLSFCFRFGGFIFVNCFHCKPGLVVKCGKAKNQKSFLFFAIQCARKFWMSIFLWLSLTCLDIFRSFLSGMNFGLRTFQRIFFVNHLKIKDYGLSN